MNRDPVAQPIVIETMLITSADQVRSRRRRTCPMGHIVSRTVLNSMDLGYFALTRGESLVIQRPDLAALS